MDNRMIKRMETAVCEIRKRRSWLKIVSVLGCTVAFCVICALILPAIAMNKDTVCGLEEHAHTESCYTLQAVEGEVSLSCDLTTLNVHVHNGDCYDASHAVICGYANYLIHVHDDRCYEDGVLVCALQQIEEHTHGESCYDEKQQKICSKAEVLSHTHTDSCFAEAEDGSKVLTCTQLEVLTHVHTDACFVPKTVQTLICGEQEHAHAEACYPAEETSQAALSEEQTEPTQEEQTEPTQEEQTEPTQEEQTEPTQDEQTEPTQEEQAEPTQEEPAPQSEQDSVIASGTCGTNATWTITEPNGVMTLTVSGEGALSFPGGEVVDFDNVSLCPWKEYIDQIEAVCIEEGVTSIGTCLFYGCDSLRSLSLPASLTSFGDYAFQSCPKLAHLTHPEGYWDAGYCYAFALTPLSGIRGTVYSDAKGVTYAFCNSYALVLSRPEGMPDSAVPDHVNIDGKNYSCLIRDGLMHYGACDDNLIWTVAEADGVTTLTVLGEGEMRFDNLGSDYANSYSCPWENYKSDFERVCIEEGVTSIFQRAFYGCYNLKEVVIPASVTSIESSAFGSCSNLATVTHPAGYWEVADTAFAYTPLRSLKGLVYTDTNGVIYTIFNGFALVAHRPEGISESEIPDYIDPTGNNYPCLIKAHLLDYGICGDNLFWTVTEPDGIQTLTVSGEGDLFIEVTEHPEYNSITTYKPWSDFSSTLQAVRIEPGVTSIGQYAFSNCQELRSVTLSETVTSIGEHAFEGCTGLKELTLPEGVTTIGVDAFRACYNLASVTLPTSMSIIRNTAFSNCSSLSRLTLGVGYVQISTSAFENTPWLFLKGTVYADSRGILYRIQGGKANPVWLPEGISEAELPEYVDPAGSNYPVVSEPVVIDSGTCGDQVTWTVSDLLGHRTLTISGTGPMSDSTYVEPAWWRYQDTIRTVIVEDGVTAIGAYAFSDHSGLREVVLADSVETIGSSAFSGCSSLQKLTLPAGYCTLTDTSFAYTPLSYLDATVYTDDNGIQYVIEEDYAVAMYLPEGVTEADIPEYIDPTGKNYPVRDGFVYSGSCGPDLTWELVHKKQHGVLTISGTGSMNDYSYADFDDMGMKAAPWNSHTDLIDSVVIEPGVTSIGAYAFYYCSQLEEITIPDSVTSIGEYAFMYCTSLTEITIPDSVTSIGNLTFYNCHNLAEITIPESVTSIGASAFNNCTSLAEINIPDSVTSIGASAFNNCTNLAEITIPESVTSIGDSAFSYCTGLQKVSIGLSDTAMNSNLFSICNQLAEIVLDEGYASVSATAFDGTNLAGVCGRIYVDAKGVIYRIASEKATVIHRPPTVADADIPSHIDPTGNNYPVVKELPVMESGTYSDAFWTLLVGRKTLTFYGAGSINGYNGYLPWDFCYTVQTIVVDKGITYIGSYASFRDYSALTEVVLPEGYITIDSDAFSGTQVSYLSGTVYTDSNGVQYEIRNNAAHVIFQPENVTDDMIPSHIDPAGKNYPVGEAGGFEDSNLCGPNLTWQLTPNKTGKTLTISGSGYMYGFDSNAPWSDQLQEITAVVIEEGVTSIGSNAFSGCTALETVYLHASELDSCNSSAFDGCAALQEIVVGAEVETLYPALFTAAKSGKGAAVPIRFAGNNYFTLAYGFEYSSNQAALGAHSGKLLPEELHYIGDNDAGQIYLISGGRAYYLHCDIPCSPVAAIPTERNDGSSYPVYTSKDYASPVPTVVRSGDSIDWLLYEKKDGSYELVITGLGNIPDYSANGAPWSGYRDQISSIHISDSITSIGDNAFNSFTQLQQVEIPRGVTAISDSAFTGCSSLIGFTVAEENPAFSAHYGILYDAAQTRLLLCPEGKTSAQQIPDTVTTVAAKAFRGNQKLSRLKLPASLAVIESQAFAGCSALSTLVLPGDGLAIGEQAFADCTGLTSVSILGTGVTVGDDAFRNCTGLENLSFAHAPEQIGALAFSGCTKLSKVSSPEGYIRMGDSPFGDCSASFQYASSGLNYVDDQGVLYWIVGDVAYCLTPKDARPSGYTMPLHTPQIGQQVACSVDTDVADFHARGTTGELAWYIVKDGARQTLVIVGQGAMGNYSGPGKAPWSSFSIADVLIKEGVTSVGQYAFYNRDTLTQVFLPSSVTNIDYDAFYDCGNLTSVTLEEGYTEIHEYSFMRTPVSYLSGTIYADSNGVYYQIREDQAYVVFQPEQVTDDMIPTHIDPEGKNYPVALEVDETVSGVKDGIRWEYVSKDGVSTLTFSGTGAIPWQYYEDMPWEHYAADVVIFEQGITSVGKYSQVQTPDTLILPEGYFKIDKGAFAYPYDYLFGTIYTDENGVSYQILEEKAHVVLRPEDVTDDMIPDIIDPTGNRYAVVKDSAMIDSGICGDGLTWKLVENQGEQELIIAGTGRMYDFASDTYGKNQLRIPWKPYMELIDRVTIGEGATSIGDNAFYNCGNLTQISIPDSVAGIGDYAFYRCANLTQISIPDTVTDIGEQAFYCCYKLAEITLPEGVTSIGASAFCGCTGLTKVTLPDSLTSLGEDAFYYCEGLTEIVIGSGVTKIESETFCRCANLAKVTLSQGYIFIDSSAFALTPVSNLEGTIYTDTNGVRYQIEDGMAYVILCPEHVTTDMIPDHIDPTGHNYPVYKETVGLDAGKCGDDLFWMLSESNGEQILTIFGTGPMYDYSYYPDVPWSQYRDAIQRVIMEDGATSIGDYAFYECYKMEEITIPEGVTTIGRYAFHACRNLTEVTLPESMTTIGRSAFYECNDLTEITIPEGVTTIEDQTFYNCNNLTEVTLPESLTTIKDQAFCNCDNLTEITIPEGVTSIGSDSFEGCSDLYKVTLNARELTSCDRYAFTYFAPIRELVIGSSVDLLSSAFLNAVSNSGAPEQVQFRGPNHFTVDGTPSGWPAIEDLLKTGGSYYADEAGILYRIADGAGTLVHVPGGLTELTVPESIPAADGSEEPLPVIGVESNALTNATELTKLTFEAPEAITQLADLAMANCPTLKSVNQQTIREEAIASFPNVTAPGQDILENTGLQTALEHMIENLQSAMGQLTVQGKQVALTIEPPTLTELYTGETSELVIGMDTPHKQETGGSGATGEEELAPLPDSVRVYFHFSSESGFFGLKNNLSSGKYKVEGIEIGVGKLEKSNIYYLEFPTTIGRTLRVPVENYFPTPEEGGTLTVWAEWTDVETGETVRSDCHRTHWRTKPDDFKLSKQPNSTPTLYGDGTEDGPLSVHELSYEITLQARNIRHEGSNRTQSEMRRIGFDYMNKVVFTDILTLPEGFAWADGVLDAIRDGEYSINYRGDISVYIGGRNRILFSLNNRYADDEKLWITEDNRIAVSWTYSESNISSVSFDLDVGDGMIVYAGTEPINLEGRFALRNDVTATQYFTHSAVQTDEVQCTHNVIPRKALMALTKTADRYKKHTHFGDPYPYTVKMSNFRSQHIETVDQIHDELPNQLYITAGDIFSMLYDDTAAELEGKTYGDYLTITVNGATIYHKQELGYVVGTGKNTYGLTYQNTSGTGTQYHGTESADVPGNIECLDSAVIQFRKHENGVSITLDKDLTDDQEGSLVGIAADAKALQAILDEMGYYVTPFCRYTVEWDFRGELPLWSGQERTFKILSCSKDDLMRIGQDHTRHSSGNGDDSGRDSISANAVIVHYRVDLPQEALPDEASGEEALPKDTQVASASTEPDALYSDFEIYIDYLKDGTPVGTNATVKNDGLVDIRITVDHDAHHIHSMVPLVSKMHGAQVLLVRAMDNPRLAEEYGLVPTTIGGIEYFILDKEGTYSLVNVGGYLADRLTVSVDENDPNQVITMVYWYLEGLSDGELRQIPLKVMLTTNGAPTNQSVFYADVEAWLNDHQSHRLWADYGIYWSFAEHEKKIVLEHTPNTTVQDVLDPDDYTILYEGDRVTYRLKLSGELSAASAQAGKTVTLSGSILHDILPLNPISASSGKPIPWTIDDLEYVYDKDKITITNEDAYQLTWTNPLTDLTSNTHQYLVWSDLFTVTFHQTADLYIYVTLTYPSGDDWNSYCQEYGSKLLENTFYFSTETDTVQHILYQPSSGVLVKGVSSTGILKQQNNQWIYLPSNEYSSRFLYSNDDGMKRGVTYYVAVYNDGNTRLYLNDIQDQLPKGFTYVPGSIRVATASGQIANIHDIDPVKYVQAHVSVYSGTNGSLTFSPEQILGMQVSPLMYDTRFSKHYLLPNQALVFSYQCFTGDVSQTDPRSVNRVAMPFLSYNLGDLQLGDATVTGTELYGTQKNDGSRELLDAGTANLLGFKDASLGHTQWLSSQVVVEAGKIIPGMEKQVTSVENSLTHEKTENPTHAGLEDWVNWTVTASNSGTTPLRNYVLTDVMQQEYIFDSAITYTIHYGDYYSSSLNITGTIISLQDLVNSKNGNAETGYSVCYSEKNPHPIFGELTVFYKPCTPTSPSVLSIDFADDKAAIPEGGRGVLSVTTRMDTEGTRRNTTYTNISYITPSQSWIETDVTTGEQVEYQGKPAVRGSAQITVANFFITDSHKTVTEIKALGDENTPVNTATSKKRAEYIVLDKRTNLFSYELTVSNIGNDNEEMEKYAVIDILPGPGDHNVLLEDNPRFSDFRVILAENPNFIVEIHLPDGTVRNPEYTVQYTTATNFTDDDWNPNGTGSVTWIDTLTDENRDQIRSFRIVLDEDETIPSHSSITVKFNAQILSDDLTNGNAAPGAVAWNSFAYRYWLDSANSYLSAEPLKVGVKIPSIPQLIKQLQTPDGREWNAEQDEIFSYVIYQQDDAVTLPDFDGLTEEEIGAALQAAGLDFTRVSLTVPEGSSQSESRTLLDLKHWSYADGVWTEGDQLWEWNHNQAYIFYELPISNSEDYAFGDISDIRENGFRYLHNHGEKMTVISTNLRRIWDINLLKISDNEQSTPLANAWFGLYSLEKPEEDIVIPEELTQAVTMELLHEDEDGVVHTYYLYDIAVSDSEGMIYWKDLRLKQYLILELQAPEGHDYDDTVHVVIRPEDVRFNTHEMSIVNRSGFEMPESGGIGTIPTYITGMLLALLAGTMLLMKKTRKEHVPS